MSKTLRYPPEGEVRDWIGLVQVKGKIVTDTTRRERATLAIWPPRYSDLAIRTLTELRCIHPNLTASVHTQISNQRTGCPIDLRYYKKVGDLTADPGILTIIQSFERIFNDRVAEAIGSEIQRERGRMESREGGSEAGEHKENAENWRPGFEYSSEEEEEGVELEWAGGGGGDGGGIFERGELGGKPDVETE